VILTLLEHVYSWPFFCGAVAGSVLWKLYCRTKAHYEDRHHPLPDGQKHTQARMSRVWLAGLSAALSLGYVLLITGHIEERTERLNTAVARCWSESYKSAKAQIDLNAQNDGISRQQQSLQREYDEETSSWLKDIIHPPGELSEQPTNSPERQAYNLARTLEYQGKLDNLGHQFDDLVNKRKVLDEQRAMHPLPEATCGR
jgi:hypothetical protein